MKNFISFILLFSAFILTVCGQNDNLQITQNKTEKIKVKGNKTIVRDKSKPVRRALEAQYAKIAEAQKNKDINALRNLRTPDFTVNMPNGETWDLETSLNYSKRGFEQVQEIIGISNTIESLDVIGDTAVAVVYQQWSRKQTMQGKTRLVETSAVQTETWTNTPDGWKLKHIGDIKPGAWTVDGKRVDPSKPYDPDAPPYNPESSDQKQPTLAGSWTGGFFADGNWVTVDINLEKEKEILSGTADIVFPSYSSSLAARNVEIKPVESNDGKIEFEIPFNTERVVFRGQISGQTILGKYEYGAARGDFGLTRIVAFDGQKLEKYYGAYRVSPTRVISIFRSLSDARAVWFIDYESGRVGTLWATSEDEFFTGDGRGVSYPATLKVSFVKDSSGAVKSLQWQSAGEPPLTAQKIAFKEEAITFQNGETTLGGTLILPPGGGRFPVVIVTPGDFGSNRNQLRWWAHNYASRGIAAFVFDSRGAGASGVNSFDRLANDVLAAVKVLKNRADINPKKIGLFGFSNSAWTVSLAASRSADIGFLIVQSLSGVPPFEQEIFRVETQLRVDKFPENIIKQGGDFMRLKFEAGRTGANWEQIEKIMNESRSERWLAYTNPPRSLEGLQRYWNTSATYDPVPALEKLKIPVLAYWGENDTYVPAAQSINVFKQAMAKAGNKNYTIKFIPQGRHDLVEGDSGSPSIGARLKKFPAGFWKMQTDWIMRQVKAVK